MKSRALMTAILCEDPLVGNARRRNVTKLRLPGTVIRPLTSLTRLAKRAERWLIYWPYMRDYSPIPATLSLASTPFLSFDLLLSL